MAMDIRGDEEEELHGVVDVGSWQQKSSMDDRDKSAGSLFQSPNVGDGAEKEDDHFMQHNLNYH